MKINKFLNLLILIISTILYVVYSRQCDDKCKQNYPYSSCNGNLNLYKGISLDGNGNVLFAGKYNSSTSGTLNNNWNFGFGLPAMFSVPIENGNCNLTKRFDIQGEILDGPGYTALDYFYQYLPSLSRYYVRFNQRGSPIFSIYNQLTNKIEPVANIFNAPFIPAFDELNNRFVYGAYGIYLVNSIPTSRSEIQNATIIYQSQIVNGIVIDNHNSSGDLYMTTYTGDFLKGTINCNNCTKDKLQVLLNDPDTSSITGLVLSNDFIYFSYSGGIKGYPKNGDKSRQRQLVSENVVSMVSDPNGNFIYYTTDSGVVKSVSTSGNHPLVNILYTPVSNGECQCAVGFEGDDCKQCNDGMVIWDSRGIPLCTKLDENKRPITCFSDYQCGTNTSPFTICNGTCTCFPGFTGTNCTLCGNGGTIIWENGYPSCSQHS